MVVERKLFGDLGVKDITKAHAIDVLLEHLVAKKKKIHLLLEMPS